MGALRSLLKNNLHTKFEENASPNDFGHVNFFNFRRQFFAVKFAQCLKFIKILGNYIKLRG